MDSMVQANPLSLYCRRVSVDKVGWNYMLSVSISGEAHGTQYGMAQTRVLRTPWPLHWLTQECSMGTSQYRPANPSVTHGHLRAHTNRVSSVGPMCCRTCLPARLCSKLQCSAKTRQQAAGGVTAAGPGGPLRPLDRKCYGMSACAWACATYAGFRV